MSIVPDYNTKNGKDYVGNKPLVMLTRKDGLMYINGRNLIEICENSLGLSNLSQKFVVKMPISSLPHNFIPCDPLHASSCLKLTKHAVNKTR